MGNSRHIGILYIVIVLLLVITYVTYKSKPDVKDVIKTEEKDGAFDVIKPTERVKDTLYIYRVRDSIIERKQPLDTVKIYKYVTLTKEEQMEEYMDAITKRTYSDTLDNKDVTISYTANTTGYLDSIDFKYKVKSFDVEVPVQKKPFATFYGGAGVSTNTDFNKQEFFGKVGVQGRNGNILNVGYGTNKTLQIEYMFKLGGKGK